MPTSNKDSHSLSNFSATSKKWNFSYVTIISVFIIELILYSTVLSYGVLHLKLVENEIITKEDSLWVPVLYIGFWKIARPWSKHICEAYDDNFAVQKLILCVSSLMITLSVLCSSFVLTQRWLFILLYGIISGVATSFIDVLIKVASYEDFQSKPKVLEGLRHLSRAIGLFIFPHVMYHLSADASYNISGSIMIFSSILLNFILPAGLVLTRSRVVNITQNLRKFRTASGLLDEPSGIEMLSLKARFLPNNEQAFSFTNKYDDMFNNDDDCDITFEEEDLNGASNHRNKTSMGVEIMPQIDEESEPESDGESKTTYQRSIQRYSKISEQFDEMIHKNDVKRKPSKEKADVLLDVRNIEMNEANFLESKLNIYAPERSGKNKIFHNISKILKKQCLHPFLKSLKVPGFYPALFTKSTVLLGNVLQIVSTPLLVLSYNSNTQKFAEVEAIFLLSLISFAWMAFLISLTWIINISKARIRIVNVFGMAICSLSFYLISIFHSQEIVTFNSLLFGLGFGIVYYTEDIVIREAIGIRPFANVEGTLDAASGIIGIIVYLTISSLYESLSEYFHIFSLILLCNALIWIIVPGLKFLWNYFETYNHRHSYIINDR